MKSTLIVIAVVLASGLLVASGALAGEGGWVTGPQAQPAGSRHEVDIMAPGYNTWDLDSSIAAGQGGGEEMTPPISSPQQGNEELSPAGSAPQEGSEEMAPAGSSSHEEYVTPHNAPYRAPAENQSY